MTDTSGFSKSSTTGIVASLDAVPALLGLNFALREQSVDLAARSWQIEVAEFVPWLCVAPVSNASPDPRLLTRMVPAGSLLTNPEHLELVAAFLRGPGSILLNNMPGGREHWPVFVEIEVTHRSAIDRFRAGRDIVIEASSLFADLFPALVDLVVPLDRQRNSGFSSHFARGAVFRAFPSTQSPTSVALDLAHELGHQAMMLLQSVDPLISSDHDAPVFSEIRGRDRPAIQSLHAGVALAYMLIAKRGFKPSTEAAHAVTEREATYDGTLEAGVTKSVRSVRRQCEMTEIGNALLIELEQLAVDS